MSSKKFHYSRTKIVLYLKIRTKSTFWVKFEEQMPLNFSFVHVHLTTCSADFPVSQNILRHEIELLSTA